MICELQNEVKDLQKCKLYHTGVFESVSGVIHNNLVFLCGEDGNLYFPEEMFLAREECEGGFIQFELEGKWGFADIYTGEIKIQPVWDFAGPFYRGYAHVSAGTQLKYDECGVITTHGGKHGYIDRTGQIVIPLEYDDADHIPKDHCFMVSKNQKWGMIDNQNRVLIPFEWDRLEKNLEGLIFASITVPSELHVGSDDKLLAAIFKIPPEPTCTERIKWGVFDQNGNVIVQPELDEKPMLYEIKQEGRRYRTPSKYYILKRKRKYGVLCEDGRLLSDITLLKKEAITLIDILYH